MLYSLTIEILAHFIKKSCFFSFTLYEKLYSFKTEILIDTNKMFFLFSVLTKTEFFKEFFLFTLKQESLTVFYIYRKQQSLKKYIFEFIWERSSVRLLSVSFIC